MAKAAKKHTPTERAARQSGGPPRTPSKAVSSNSRVRLQYAYRQLRKELEPDEVVQLLLTRLCEWPRMPCWIRYVGIDGKITWSSALPVEFWQTGEASLSAGINDTTGTDYLKIDYIDQTHPAISYSRPQFHIQLRALQRELEQLRPAPAAPEPALNKEPTPKKKRRKAKSARVKARRRGPKAKILPPLIDAMKNDVSERKLSLDQLEAMSDKELAHKYSAKRERVRTARQSVIEYYQQLPTIADKK